MANRADSREIGMTCKYCDEASKGLHHGFAAQCPGCQARAVARSPEFSQAVKTRNQHAEYRMLLKAEKVTHDEAQHAARNDRACDNLMELMK